MGHIPGNEICHGIAHLVGQHGVVKVIADFHAAQIKVHRAHIDVHLDGARVKILHDFVHVNGDGRWVKGRQGAGVNLHAAHIYGQRAGVNLQLAIVNLERARQRRFVNSEQGAQVKAV